MALAEFLSAKHDRRTVLRTSIRLSPFFIPGVASACAASGPDQGHATEQVGERTVISFPSSSRPNAETMRKIEAYTPPGAAPSKETSPIMLFRADQRISNVIGQHVRKIMDAGFGAHLDDQDFFHGHLFVNDPSVCHYEKATPVIASPLGMKSRYPVDNLPKYLSYRDWITSFLRSDPYIVYHTRERITGQPESFQVDPQGRNIVVVPQTDYSGPPRSIIGTMAGETYTMRSNDNPDYTKYGSVHGIEAFEFDGKTSEGMCEVQPDSAIFSAGGKRYTGTQMIYILPDSSGRYKLTSGLKFDIYHKLA